MVNRAILYHGVTYLIRFHGDNSAQCKYKWVDIFLVQIERSHSIGDRVVGQNLRENKFLSITTVKPKINNTVIKKFNSYKVN